MVAALSDTHVRGDGQVMEGKRVWGGAGEE